MQMESYKHFWKIAHNDPSSGVDMRMCRQYYDETDIRNPRDCEKLWGKNFLAKYRYLSQDELPKQLRGITFGEEYLSMSINPWLYLPWIRTKLESMGVRFIQKQVNSIHNIKADIIINATGLGSEKLNGVNDQQVEAVRGQTMWVKSDYTGFMAIRHGIEYTYVIPRALSGGVIFGGVSDSSNFNVKPEYETKRDIMERVRDLIPEVVSNAQELKKLTNKNSSSDANAELVESVDIIRDIVAFRPGRKGEARVEVVKQSPVLVHAYGFEGSGYIYSGGVAWKVRQELDSLTGHQRNCSKL
jgi:D-amino-acid oxidase